MKFPGPLIEGTLVRRYKRFLADVILSDGTQVTVHTPNTGSMLGCAEPGSRVWLSLSDNPKRKYPHSWDLVEALPDVLVGINTQLPNRLVEEAINTGVIESLQGYGTLRREVRYGAENSRIDLLLADHPEQPDCFVEVKNVTAVEGNGVAIFPDAVSERGSKHLRELAGVVAQGMRGVILYCVQRGDAVAFRPADAIDPVYGDTLRQVMPLGVEALAYRADVSPEGVILRHPLPVCI